MEIELLREKKIQINQNWKTGSDVSILHEIHNTKTNISIFDRNIEFLNKNIESLIHQNVNFSISGNIDEIMDQIKSKIDPTQFSLIIDDIHFLVSNFQEITKNKTFRLLLATVNTNMCRKFHTDVNDLRLLCTYSGPGTLWLTDDNINLKAFRPGNEDESIALNESEIQQANTGSVVILKGAIYPDEKSEAVVHRSPTIEETGEQRLLLRIDTNENIYF